MLYTPSYGNSQLKMEILEFTSKEAAAPLMLVAALCGFGNFGKKFQNFDFFLKISKTTEGPPLRSKGPPPPY